MQSDMYNMTGSSNWKKLVFGEGEEPRGWA